MATAGHVHDETTRLLDVYTPLRTGYLAIGDERVQTRFADMTEAVAEEAEEERFPTGQLCVLAFVRIIEPITFTSVLPYIYSQTRHLLTSPSDPHPTGSIALYSALLISSFAFSETLTSHLWGTLSDKYGRKPIILFGLAGSLLSLLLYGLAPNIALAMTARIVGGLLNGNVGVLQTAVMELTGAREDWRAKGQLVLPFVWCLGSIIGPAIGGGLAPSGHEAEEDSGVAQVYQLGDDIPITGRFPYLLPNIVCALVALMGIVVGWLWMEETNKMVAKNDMGLAVGRYILGGPRALLAQLLKRADTAPPPPPPVDVGDEGNGTTKEVDDAEEADRVSIYESSALTTANPSSSTSLYASLSALDSNASTIVGSTTTLSTPADKSAAAAAAASGKKSIYTPRFYLLMAGFFILYYHTTAAEHLLAIFLQSSPLPPLFPGTSIGLLPTEGFGFTTHSMGMLFLIQGVFQMALQFTAFPFLARRWSNMNIYIATLCLYPLFYALMPLLVLLPPGSPVFYAGLAGLLALKVVLEITCYPALFLVLYETAVTGPGGAGAMGSVYGLSAAVAGAAKGVGPVVTGGMWKLGVVGGGVGCAWWALAGVGLVGLVAAVGLVVAGGGGGEWKGGKAVEGRGEGVEV
ncbi:major facilitator superfamily domain-containing protein [Morchella snyderi]|nr:major facilitator superfamily domain-containing protein [Morchella snyderi]